MKVKVRDFQSLGKVDIEANGLTVLVGPSNWGKSALVRAITAALFNRPGEDFIRHGSTQAQVLLENLPSVTGTPLTVLWQKGHNLNQFTVNGVEYKKVGVNAPDVLASSGYRDIFIGDKERQKGKEIRPQIGGQFDKPFLLDEQGSFINDVLSVVSRLGVLLNANGRCSKDLKAQRSTLTVRQKDLKTGEVKLAALQPIVDLHARVLALQAKLDEAKKVGALLDKVRGLVARRAALKTFVDATTIPEATAVPEDLGVQRLLSGMALVRQRAAVLHVKDLTLPAHDATVEQRLNTAGRDVVRIAEGRAALVRRPALARVAVLKIDAVDLPGGEFMTANLAKLDEWVKTAATLKAALATRETATTVVYNAMSGLDSVQTLQVEADAALVTALEGVKICPVCEQAMPTVAASV